jgi:hypothetical protein
LRHQQRLQRARIASFLEAAVKGIQRGIEVVKENETGQRIGEICFPLRKSNAQRRRVHEPRHVIKHRGAKKRFDRLQNKGTAIGAGDPQIALEEKENVAEDLPHTGVDSPAE